MLVAMEIWVKASYVHVNLRMFVLFMDTCCSAEDHRQLASGQAGVTALLNSSRPACCGMFDHISNVTYTKTMAGS